MSAGIGLTGPLLAAAVVAELAGLYGKIPFLLLVNVNFLLITAITSDPEREKFICLKPIIMAILNLKIILEKCYFNN